MTTSIAKSSASVPRLLLLLVPLWALNTDFATAQDRVYTNLQVLPTDISNDDLGQVMINNLRGLGLPRRGGKGCLFCHVGSMDGPRDAWDFASDEKVEKRKAREMIAMTAEINQRLATLEGRVAPELEVTCYTCHKGRTDPRSLTDLMDEAYRADGIDAAITVHRDTRERYYGSDAYDFRPSTLFRYALELASRGKYQDAVALSQANQEFHPEDLDIRRKTLMLKLEQELSDHGVETTLEMLENARSSEPEGTIHWTVLDNIGWAFFRKDRQQDALALFHRNAELFADKYVPNESLAEALFDVGQTEDGLAILERWIEKHPEDKQAQQVLLNLRQRAP